MKFKAQRGVVLLMALSVFTLVATLSVKTLVYGERSASLYEALNREARVQQGLLAGEAWGKVWIEEHHATMNRIVELSMERPWHVLHDVIPLPEQNAKLIVDVVDRQSCINLNALNNEQELDLTKQRLTRLSVALGLMPNWIDLVQDWVDEDQVLSSISSHEDEFYLGQVPAYRTSGHAIRDWSELSLLPVDESVWQVIAPYVCLGATNHPNAINVQRLNVPLVKAFVPGFTDSDAEALRTRLATSGFDSVESFLSWNVIAKRSVNEVDWLSESQAFDIYISLESPDRRRYLHTMLVREEQGGWSPYSRSYASFDALARALLSNRIVGQN